MTTSGLDSNLDELEKLLLDLDSNRKSVAPPPSQRKQMAKSTINVDELDDIIGGLSGDSSAPPPRAAPQNAQAYNAPKPAASIMVESKPTPQNYGGNGQYQAQHQQYQQPANNRNTMENIDELLKGLEPPSRASRPISVVKHNDNQPFAYNTNKTNNVPVQATRQPANQSPQQQRQQNNGPQYAQAQQQHAQYHPQQQGQYNQQTGQYPHQQQQQQYNQGQYSPNQGHTQKVYVTKGPTVKPAQGDDLANLLDDITKSATDFNMNAPVGRGQCAACGRNILGEVISALGRNYHPEHFQCGNCRAPLGTSSFFEQDGVAHCEKCYQELLCPRCAHCDEAILDRCVTALGRKWHMHHFICTQCLSPFNNGTYFERDNRPYCDKCFSGNFAPRCAGCNQPITGECTNALGQSWHPEHFVCQYCQKAFNGAYFEFGGKPYCDVHYHQQTGSLCAGCGKAVTGKCVNALDKRWHPEHFVCAFCMNPLMAGNYSENGNKAYCRECHGKLFG